MKTHGLGMGYHRPSSNPASLKGRQCISDAQRDVPITLKQKPPWEKSATVCQDCGSPVLPGTCCGVCNAQRPLGQK